MLPSLRQSLVELAVEETHDRSVLLEWARWKSLARNVEWAVYGCCQPTAHTSPSLVAPGRRAQPNTPTFG